MSNERSVTPLELRKRILLMESDLNRAQLCQELSILSDDLRALGDKVSSATTLASTFFTAFAPENHGASEEEATPAKPSWMSTIAKGVRFGTSLWLAYRNKS